MHISEVTGDALFAAYQAALKLRGTEVAAWDMYFCSLCAMAMHPGNREKVTLEQCSEMADAMIEVRRFRIDTGR